MGEGEEERAGGNDGQDAYVFGGDGSCQGKRVEGEGGADHEGGLGEEVEGVWGDGYAGSDAGGLDLGCGEVGLVMDGIVVRPSGDGRGWWFFFSCMQGAQMGHAGLENGEQVCVFVVRGWFSRGYFARPMKGF